MKLTREQVNQLDLLFEQNSAIADVNLVEESNSGIGINLYAEYTGPTGLTIRKDITDYAMW